MAENKDWVLTAGTVKRKASDVKPEELEELAEYAQKNGAELVIKGGGDGDTLEITPQMTVIEGTGTTKNKPL